MYFLLNNIIINEAYDELKMNYKLFTSKNKSKEEKISFNNINE